MGRQDLSDKASFETKSIEQHLGQKQGVVEV